MVGSHCTLQIARRDELDPLRCLDWVPGDICILLVFTNIESLKPI